MRRRVRRSGLSSAKCGRGRARPPADRPARLSIACVAPDVTNGDGSLPTDCPYPRSHSHVLRSRGAPRGRMAAYPRMSVVHYEHPHGGLGSSGGRVAARARTTLTALRSVTPSLPSLSSRFRGFRRRDKPHGPASCQIWSHPSRAGAAGPRAIRAKRELVGLRGAARPQRFRYRCSADRVLRPGSLPHRPSRPRRSDRSRK